ncbi:hypothetical protein J4E93_003282 [Alternaria ventricosa]|uniref:uncharacterized protein n=1 Tax=Alternaria ventricosa TaxID=1187951 RepID=UPI0020C3C28F|nr:uncharacterized protein J4E93_003282 [Alternaria ventricosa]KAI4650925.1 hypothetical protein J4E93_003282 [Alternaria ventricosa]
MFGHVHPVGWTSDYIRGSRVRVEAAPSGNYIVNDNHDGFVRPGLSGPDSALPGRPYGTRGLTDSDFPALGITREDEARRREEQAVRLREAREARVKESQLLQEEHEKVVREREEESRKNRELEAQAKARAEQKRADLAELIPQVLQNLGDVLPPHRVPSPDLDNREDTRNRVLFMTDIPPELDNDVVMAFLHPFRPEGIDRAELGGNRMLSAIILMQTAEGRDEAVAQLNGTTLAGQRVVLQAFNNVTQDVLDRVLNPPVPSAPSSSNPPPSSSSYSPFGASQTTSPDPPAPDITALTAVLRNLNLVQEPTPAPPQSAPRGRGRGRGSSSNRRSSGRGRGRGTAQPSGQVAQPPWNYNQTSYSLTRADADRINADRQRRNGNIRGGRGGRGGRPGGRGNGRGQ